MPKSEYNGEVSWHEWCDLVPWEGSETSESGCKEEDNDISEEFDARSL